jgi:hypothetical protein
MANFGYGLKEQCTPRLRPRRHHRTYFSLRSGQKRKAWSSTRAFRWRSCWPFHEREPEPDEHRLIARRAFLTLFMYLYSVRSLSPHIPTLSAPAHARRLL